MEIIRCDVTYLIRYFGRTCCFHLQCRISSHEGRVSYNGKDSSGTGVTSDAIGGGSPEIV